MPRSIFITGVAGFIGSHVARAMLSRGWQVIGVDHEQAAPALVPLRLGDLREQSGFCYVKMDVQDQAALEALFAAHPGIDTVLHLAARAGVRQSRLTPHAYMGDNIGGHISLLEACRTLPQLRQILYASSSAVYGPSAPLPFSESMAVGGQASFYATTKRMNELTAQTYSHLYGFAQTGLRFFTVYGPMGRPDMACYGFARAIRDDQPLTLWAENNLARDFTYIDDVVAAIVQLVLQTKCPIGNRLFNIGCGQPRPVMALIQSLEAALGKSAHIQQASRPVEDMIRTWADITALQEVVSWRPHTGLEEGIARFCAWFCRHSPL